MAVGPLVRRCFGQHERRIADLYRAVFVDLESVVRQIHDWSPAPKRILEVGCGEGSMTERLASVYPLAAITAIDVTPRLGRLYQGRKAGVVFRQIAVETIARESPGQFDLVVLCDVLHHVSPLNRSSLLRSIALCVDRDGVFVVKEWLRSNSAIHGLCWLSDVALTGDRVEYFSEPELRSALNHAFETSPPRRAVRIRPWSNNAMLKSTVRIDAEGQLL